MKKHVKNAAVLASLFILMKLAIKFVFLGGATKFFEDGLWMGLSVIALSFFIAFIIALIVFVVKDK